MRNKIEEIELFLLTENVDILCISETWLGLDEIQFIHFFNYNISSYYCRNMYLHGGVLILVKNNLMCTEITCLTELSMDKLFECSAVTLTISDIKYCIVCLYRAPNTDVNVFLSKFEECLNLICKLNVHKIIICGDININYMCRNNATINLDDLIHSFNLLSIFNEPTRIFNNLSSAVDYILTNFDILDKKIIHTGISDHSAQKITFETNKANLNSSIKFRSFSKKNISNFILYLGDEKWHSVFNEQSVDKKFTVFAETVAYYYHSCFKMVTKTINTNSKEKLWLTTGIKISSIRLKELYNLMTLSVVDKQYYKNYKSIYRRVIKQAKRLYFDKIIIDSENKSRTIWKIINKNVKRNNRVSEVATIKINNNEISDKKIIADSFNSYFVNLPKTLLSPNSNTGKKSVDSVPRTENSIYLEPVTELEVLEAINNLKNSNSTGYDNLSVKIIKQCASLIAKPLCHIINQCFIDGCFPSLLKISKVICLHKKGDINEISNYRPISLLSVFSKIFEKLLATRIIKFLEKNKIFSPNQHGFRENHSTISALVSILDYVYKNIDKGNKVMAIFVDLSKAFDCVNHDTLLKKIECYGLRGQCNMLLSSYLSNRTQFVEYLGEQSERLMTDIGVPQGSVLGPLLFLLYINDVDEYISTFYCAFADDMTLVASDVTTEAMITKHKNNLHRISNYMTNTGLVMNQGKTFSLQFHPIGSNYTSSPLLKLNGKSIQQVEDFKLLGIYIDLSLNWKTHVNVICKKCASLCFAVKRLCQITSLSTVKVFYYSCFESVIRYCIICWGNSVTSERAFILQKRVVRFMFGLKYRESCRNTFIHEKILTLPCLYILELLTFVKQNIVSFLRQNIYHEYPTRHGSNLQYNIHRLEMFKENPYYMGTVLYNKLGNNIKNITSIKKFKSAVRQYLVSNAFYSVEEYLMSENTNSV